MSANFDLSNLALKAVCPNNEILYDDKGKPSIMVKIPKMTYAQLGLGSSQATHPAFIVNGQEVDAIYISKYQNIVMDGRAYSLPGEDPKANITLDGAISACSAKGAGWHLMTRAEWAMLALWCKANGTQPKGNNNYGKDHAYAHETGVESMARDSSNRIQRTATGSGPATWNHNWLPDGIADLNGNVSEWCAGLRLVDGEIQIIPNANSMDPEISLAANSASWKAIATDGSLVDPGTAGSLKYDYLSSKITLINGTVTDDGSTYRSTGFKDLALASGLTAPELALALTLVPFESGDVYGGDTRYVTLAGERVPYCGGYWIISSGAGVFCVNLNLERSIASEYFGFRSAYCDL